MFMCALLLGHSFCSCCSGGMEKQKEVAENSVTIEKMQELDEEKCPCDIQGFGVELRDGDSVSYDLIEISPEDVLNYYTSYEIVDGFKNMDVQAKYLDYAMAVYGEALKKLGYKTPNERTIKDRTEKIFRVDMCSVNNDIAYVFGVWRYLYDKENGKGRTKQDSVAFNDIENFWNSFLYDDRYSFFVKQPSINGVVLGGECEWGCENGGYKIGNDISFVYNRKKIVETLHFNNFIFYGDEKSLHWLVDNSPNLLRNLFFLYGYDENPTINELVMKDAEEKVGGNSEMESIEEAYENLFASHDRDGRLRIHEGFLKFLKKRESDGYRNIDMLLASYAGTMVSSLKDGDTSSFFPGFSHEERMIIAAYTEVYKRHDPCESDEFRQEWINNPAFARFVETNGYFGLEDLKEIVDNYK